MTQDFPNISNMFSNCEIKVNIPLRLIFWNICKQSTHHLYTSPNHEALRWWRIKMNVQFFRERRTKRIFKKLPFCRNPLNILFCYDTGKLILLLFIFIFESKILSLKHLKSLCQHICTVNRSTVYIKECMA